VVAAIFDASAPGDQFSNLEFVTLQPEYTSLHFNIKFFPQKWVLQYTFCKNQIQHCLGYLCVVNHQNTFTACCQSCQLSTFCAVGSYHPSQYDVMVVRHF